MNKLSMFVFLIVVLIAANGAANAISLEAPQARGEAFPEDEVGIAAYINTEQSISLEKIKTIFYEVSEVGDNYIVGKTYISDYGGSIPVNLYADTDGWIVAYIPNDQPVSYIMQWGSADVNNPDIGVIKSTTLEDALYKAGDAAGVGIVANKIKYYDFEFPNANNLMIISKTQSSSGTASFQLEMPEEYILYEASYYHYIYYYSYHKNYKDTYWDSNLYVDGSLISDASTSYQGDECYAWWRGIDQYKGAITPGTLHKISISYTKTHSESWDGGSAGVATVLIYRSE